MNLVGAGEPDAGLLCPRLPETAPDYSAMVPERDVLLTARASRMSRGEESRLAETELASAHLKCQRLTPELSGQINREAIDWSA